MTGFKHLTEVKKQYRINIKKLKQIYSVAEGDAKAKAFVKNQNYKEIAYLERAIAKYEERTVTQDENLIEEILEKHLHKISPQGDLTNIARQALFTQAQILINESEIDANIITKVESIWNAFELCKIPDYNLCFHEMMNSRSKKKDLHDVTEYKYGPYHKYAISYFDVEVYLSHKTYEEASQTKKIYLKSNFQTCHSKWL